MVRLTKKQKKFYEDNGYIVLKNIVPPADLDRMSEEFDKLFARMEPENPSCGENGKSIPHSVTGVQNLQFHHAVFSKYLFNESLLDAIEDTLGSENIVLHHTFGCCMEARREHPMHQDYHYFPHEKDNNMVGALLHLDNFHPDQGGLFVYPGSHKLGPLEDVGAKLGNFHFVDQKRFPMEKATLLTADRGDIVILSYLLVHGSSPNCSNHPRRLFLAQVAGYNWMVKAGSRVLWCILGEDYVQQETVSDRRAKLQNDNDDNLATTADELLSTILMASADNGSRTKLPRKPCQGLLLRGVNLHRAITLSKRFEN